MNVLIAASIISCVAILIVIAYGSLTLGYGEEEDLSSHPAHVIRTVSTACAHRCGAGQASLPPRMLVSLPTMCRPGMSLEVVKPG